MGLDLSGQTSASYNMRLNYERCLLDFENYLGSGQYAADLAAGTAPHFTSVTEPQRNFGHLPPPDMGHRGRCQRCSHPRGALHSIVDDGDSVRDDNLSPARGLCWITESEA